MLTFFYNVFLSLFILEAGDIERHRNVNSLATDNYAKVLALKAYISTYKYDFICDTFICETFPFLDSSFESDDKDLMLMAIIWFDLITQVTLRGGGVCFYYKESLPVRLVDITFLPECLVYEIKIQNKKGYVAIMYRSPSQSSIGFESFLTGFEHMLSSVLFSKSQFTVILGDFNARSPTWW